MGNPLDPDNRPGAMVSQAHLEKVRSYLEQAAAEKLAVAFGGETGQGIFVLPTVVDGVDPDSRLFQEETFGPVLPVTAFTTRDEAIALANDSVYGRAAPVYTDDLRQAIKASREPRRRGHGELFWRR
jgi:gamma-glutamyl-gamma-aminobutyraldehyde dehydrogenase